MKNTWNLIYIIVGIIGIYIAIIVPSFTFWAGFGGIGSLFLGLYEMYTDYKNTTTDQVDYDITNSSKNVSSENDNDLLIEEYVKSKYHVTKYQFQIIIAILAMGVLIISVIFPVFILIIVLTLVIWKLYNSKIKN